MFRSRKFCVDTRIARLDCHWPSERYVCTSSEGSTVSCNVLRCRGVAMSYVLADRLGNPWLLRLVPWSTGKNSGTPFVTTIERVCKIWYFRRYKWTGFPLKTFSFQIARFDKNRHFDHHFGKLLNFLFILRPRFFVFRCFLHLSTQFLSISKCDSTLPPLTFERFIRSNLILSAHFCYFVHLFKSRWWVFFKNLRLGINRFLIFEAINTFRSRGIPLFSASYVERTARSG